MSSAHDILQSVFGYPSFRPPQDQIIEAIILFSMLGLYSCHESLKDIPPINYGLSVQITSPSAGERFDDLTVIAAAVESDYDIDYVELEVDGRIVSRDTEEPYECNWYVWFWAEDSLHTISATAIDEHGNTAASEEVEVVVDSTCWREPILIEPLDGEVIDRSGIIHFKWYPFEGATDYLVLLSIPDSEDYLILETTCLWDMYFFCATRDTTSLHCNDEVIDVQDLRWILNVYTPGKKLIFEYSYSIYIDYTQFP